MNDLVQSAICPDCGFVRACSVREYLVSPSTLCGRSLDMLYQVQANTFGQCDKRTVIRLRAKMAAVEQRLVPLLSGEGQAFLTLPKRFLVELQELLK